MEVSFEWSKEMRSVFAAFCNSFCSCQARRAPNGLRFALLCRDRSIMERGNSSRSSKGAGEHGCAAALAVVVAAKQKKTIVRVFQLILLSWSYSSAFDSSSSSSTFRGMSEEAAPTVLPRSSPSLSRLLLARSLVAPLFSLPSLLSPKTRHLLDNLVFLDLGRLDLVFFGLLKCFYSGFGCGKTSRE